MNCGYRDLLADRSRVVFQAAVPVPNPIHRMTVTMGGLAITRTSFVPRKIRSSCRRQLKAIPNRTAIRRSGASRVHKTWASFTDAQRMWASMSPMPLP